MSEVIRIATRGSHLALWQARWVASKLEMQGWQSEFVIIETQGDREAMPFAQMKGQGFFTKAIQDAVLAGQADIAVHSYKDLPSSEVQGLTVAAISEREDVRDVVLIRPEVFDATRLIPVRSGATVGTSAVRRQSLLRYLRPDLKVVELRGNIPTRLEKLRQGDCQAIVLANAGIKRLRLDVSELHVHVLDPNYFVPAPAQGALAIECQEMNASLRELLKGINDIASSITVGTERLLMSYLAGGCQLALGASAQYAKDNLTLIAWYGEHYYHAQGFSPQSVAEDVVDQIRYRHGEVVNGLKS